MSMKIIWHDLLTETIDDPNRPGADIYKDGLARLAKKVVRADTNVTVKSVPSSTGSMHLCYPATINGVIVTNQVIKSEEEGCDAVILGSYNDIGVEMSREAAKIPVIGSGEAGMMLAQLLGRKFAVVTVHPHYIPQMERNIFINGWQDRAISNKPLRSIPPVPFYWPHMIDAFQGKPEWVIDAFEKVALECIEDGADVLMVGCVPLAAAMALNDYREVSNTGVPVVCPPAAALKIAEIMVDLKRTLGLTKSEAVGAPYQSPPAPMLAKIVEMLGL